MNMPSEYGGNLFFARERFSIKVITDSIWSHSNFSNYKHRFTMPEGQFGDMYYSFDAGPVHFVSISTEFYYYLNFGIHTVIRQHHWLEQDLRKAVLNRESTPWIVIFGHRPMYCTGKDKVRSNVEED